MLTHLKYYSFLCRTPTRPQGLSTTTVPWCHIATGGTHFRPSAAPIPGSPGRLLGPPGRGLGGGARDMRGPSSRIALPVAVLGVRKGGALPGARRDARGGANLVLRSGRRNAAAVREEKGEGRCVTPIDRRTSLPSHTLGRLPAGHTWPHQPRSRSRPRGCAASAPPPSCTFQG